MCSRRNAADVASSFMELLELTTNYETAHDSLIDNIQSEDARDAEGARFDRNIQVINAFCQQCEKWMEEVDTASTSSRASSHRSHTKSTRSSAGTSMTSVARRVEEKARIAELQAERDMLERRQHVETERRAFEIDLKIQKALAREQACDSAHPLSSLNVSQLLDDDSAQRTANWSEQHKQPQHEQQRQQQPQHEHLQAQPHIEQQLQAQPHIEQQQQQKDGNEHLCYHDSIDEFDPFHFNTLNPLINDPMLNQKSPINEIDNKLFPNFFCPTTEHADSTANYRHTNPTIAPIRNSILKRPPPVPANLSFPQPESQAPISASFTKPPPMSVSHLSPLFSSNCHFSNPSSNPPMPSVAQFQSPFIDNVPNAMPIQSHSQSLLGLPKLDIEPFSGKVSDYRIFINAFDSRIANKLVAQQDKLHYLNQFLRGEPRELIEPCFFLSASACPYDEARRVLDKSYGNAYTLSMSYINELNEWSAVKADSPMALRKYSAFLDRCLCAMRGTNHEYLLNHPTTLLSAIGKLPKYMQNKWREIAHNISLTRTVTFSDVCKHVYCLSEVDNDPVFGKLRSTDQTKLSNSKPKSVMHSNFSTNVTSTQSNSKKCIFCQSSTTHDTDDCYKFKKLSIKEKRDFLAKAKLCFACFGADHWANTCSAKRTCKHCSGPHPSSLHDDDFSKRTKFARNNKRRDNNSSLNSDVTSANIVNETNGVVLAVSNVNKERAPRTVQAILPVMITQKEKCCITYCLYDSGSTGCFMSERLCEDMDLTNQKTRLKLKTMHGSSIDDSRAIDNLVIKDATGGNAIVLPRTYTRDV